MSQASVFLLIHFLPSAIIYSCIYPGSPTNVPIEVAYKVVKRVAFKSDLLGSMISSLLPPLFLGQVTSM